MAFMQTYMEKLDIAPPLYLKTVSDGQGFDMITLIENFCTWYEQALAARELQLTTKISSQIPRYCLGNRRFVKHIFSETGKNSLLYLGAGRVLLEVEAVQLAGRRHAIYLTITFSGNGIPLIKEKTLFQPSSSQSGENSFRLRSANLYYARMIARILGGDIRIANELGFGTRYQVEIRLLSAPV